MNKPKPPVGHQQQGDEQKSDIIAAGCHVYQQQNSAI